MRGQIVNEEMEPLEGVAVYCNNQNFMPFVGRTVTDKNGRFDLLSLPGGNVAGGGQSIIGFNKNGYYHAEEDLVPLDSPDIVTITIRRMRVAVVKITDASTGTAIQTFGIRTSLPVRQATSQLGLPTIYSRGSVHHSKDGIFRMEATAQARRLLISAEGYSRENVEVDPQLDGHVKPIEVRLQPWDPASVRKYSGRLLNSAGQPVKGAQLRLIATHSPVTGDARGIKFTLIDIQQGRRFDQPDVAAIVEATTDAGGRFEFSQIPDIANAELVWWGKDIAPGRMLNLAEQTVEDAMALEIVVPDPGQIIGMIDRKRFPEANTIRIDGTTGIEPAVTRLELTPSQEQFEMTNLAPGRYKLTLQNWRVHTSVPNGNQTTKPLATMNITVFAGKTTHVEANDFIGGK